MTISSDKRQLFVTMGERIASIRKSRKLSVSLMELFGEEKHGVAARSVGGKGEPVPQWQQHIKAIAKLPRSQQQFVAEMLKNVLSRGAAQ